jgi:hypothetical protein
MLVGLACIYASRQAGGVCERERERERGLYWLVGRQEGGRERERERGACI